jgi:hypothetical protein
MQRSAAERIVIIESDAGCAPFEDVTEAMEVNNEKVVALRPRPEFQPLLAVSCDSPTTSAG